MAELWVRSIFAYDSGMATHPLDTAKLYALTSAGACSVTLTQGGKSITWEALAEGGQTSFIVPAGATAEVSDSSALLSPLPANFKAALGAGKVRIEGERMTTADLDSQGCSEVNMRHTQWCALPPQVSRCVICPAIPTGRAFSMQLLLTPARDMDGNWLRTTEGQTINWLYGEPTILSGFTYIIGLTQLAPDKILANLLATF